VRQNVRKALLLTTMTAAALGLASTGVANGLLAEGGQQAALGVAGPSDDICLDYFLHICVHKT
jgi:hypothetical protein